MQHKLECWSAADAFASTQALRAGIFGLLLWLDIQPLAECAADLSDVARVAMLIFFKKKYQTLMPILYVSSYYCICIFILLYMCPLTTIYVSSATIYVGSFY